VWSAARCGHDLCAQRQQAAAVRPAREGGRAHRNWHGRVALAPRRRRQPRLLLLLLRLLLLLLRRRKKRRQTLSPALEHRPEASRPLRGRRRERRDAAARRRRRQRWPRRRQRRRQRRRRSPEDARAQLQHCFIDTVQQLREPASGAAKTKHPPRTKPNLRSLRRASRIHQNSYSMYEYMA